MTYKEARVYLDNVSKYGSVLGLDTIRELLCELGNPQDSLRFIHIAGTNGKGSVLACTSTMLSEAGYRTGRYVSPTVVSYLERIQVDGTWIDEDTFARLTEIVQRAIARMEEAGKPVPTAFEAETAIAFLYFKERNCDIVVLECGLGGELDATNIIKNTLCAVFASISRDHLGIIGNTLEEIAQTKAGIIKPGCMVITTVQKPEVMEVLRSRTEKLNCPLFIADKSLADVSAEDFTGQTITYKDFRDVRCPLAGRYQLDNAVLALEVMRALSASGYCIPSQAVRHGLEKTQWPGRFTCLMREPIFFIDGAHNEDAAKRLRESVEAYFPGKRLIFIMGVFRDKEYEKIAAIMGPLAKSVHTVSLPDSGRTLPAAETAAVMKKHCSPDVPVQCDDSIQNAVHRALAEAERGDIILSFGSLSYLGRIMEIINLLKIQER